MLFLIVSIIGSIFIILGLIGCVLPVLPGPPLSFIGLLMLALVRHFSPPLTATLLIIMFIIATVATGADYVTPSLGAKRYGASKWGIWGSVVGMIIGIFYFPPFGMMIGAFIGAAAGEMLVGKRGMAVLRASKGIFMGVLLGVALKLAASGVITYYFVRGLF